MDDLNKYIHKRKKNSKEFATEFDTGYQDFKIGVILKNARQKAGLTQEEVAIRLHTKNLQYLVLKTMLKISVYLR